MTHTAARDEPAVALITRAEVARAAAMRVAVDRLVKKLVGQGEFWCE